MLVKPMTFPALIRVNLPWPPMKRVVLYKFSVGDMTVAFSGEVDGHLRSIVVKNDQTISSQDYQVISMSDSGVVISIMVLEIDGNISPYLNGERLLSRTEAAGAVRYVQVAPITRGPPAISGLPDPDNLANPAERLFVNTVADLFSKVESGQPYQILRASALVRQLLVDGSRLLIPINRSYHKKVRFKLIEFFQQPPGFNVVFAWHSIDPFLIPSASTVELDLDGFLSAPCMSNLGKTFSIRNVIKVCANAKGGVHFGYSTEVEESELLKLDQLYKFFDQEPSIAALTQIATVAL